MKAILTDRDGQREIGEKLTFVKKLSNQPPSKDTIVLIEAQPLQAKIYRDQQGSYVIEHLGGAQGTPTYIKTKKGKEEVPLPAKLRHRLEDGDEIRIGHALYTFNSKRTSKSSEGGAGCGAVLVILLILGVFAINQNSTAGDTLTSFCSNLTSANYQDAYGQFTDQVKSQETELQFATKLRQDTISDCNVGTVKENGSKADGILTYTFTGDKTAKLSLHLVKQNDTWKIDDKIP